MDRLLDGAGLYRRDPATARQRLTDMLQDLPAAVQHEYGAAVPLLPLPLDWEGVNESVRLMVASRAALTAALNFAGDLLEHVMPYSDASWCVPRGR